MPRRVLLLGALGVLCALPTGAFAARTATSTNWGGYAATGRTFRAVSATWVQPKATCDGGVASSAYWVGLGGFSSANSALEQIGTQSDCDRDGNVTYSSW